jgi:hypothetical protein
MASPRCASAGPRERPNRTTELQFSDGPPGFADLPTQHPTGLHKRDVVSRQFEASFPCDLLQSPSNGRNRGSRAIATSMTQVPMDRFQTFGVFPCRSNRRADRSPAKSLALIIACNASSFRRGKFLTSPGSQFFMSPDIPQRQGHRVFQNRRPRSPSRYNVQDVRREILA